MMGDRFLILILVMALSVVLSSPVGADYSEVKIDVDGMSCPLCVHGLQKTLGKIKGLRDIDISYKKGTVQANWDESHVFDKQSIRQAVLDAGMTPRSVLYEPSDE